MEKQIGKVTHYYSKINVAIVDMMDEIKIGDRIHILGHITDFTQDVISMEIAHKKIEKVDPGMEVALKVEDYVRQGDEIYKIID